VALRLVHNGKLNCIAAYSTELNWVVQFSSVFRCILNRRRAATTVNGRRRLFSWRQELRQRPSPAVAGFRPMIDLAGWQCTPIVKNVWRPPISSPNRRGSSPVQCTAGNWTELNWTNSSVQFIFRCALGFTGLGSCSTEIHFMSSPVMSRLTTSSFTCQLISIIITTLIVYHSFTPGSKPTFSTNPSHLRLLLPITYRTAFMTTGLDRSYHGHRFIFKRLTLL